MGRKKILIPLILIILVVAALFTIVSSGFFQEKTEMQLDMKYSLSTKEYGREPGLEIISSPEAKELEIKTNELEYLYNLAMVYLAEKYEQIKSEELVEQLEYSKLYRDISAWLELDDHFLPRDLFKPPEEKPGFLDTTYNVGYAFIPAEQKYNKLEGSLVSAVTVRSSNLKTLINPKVSEEIKTHIYIFSCQGMTEGYDKRISSYIEASLFFTFIHSPDGDEVMLDVVSSSRNSVDYRGVKLADFLMGITLKGKDVFREHLIWYDLHQRRDPLFISVLEQTSNIEAEGMGSISQLINEGKVRRFTLPHRVLYYHEIYAGDYQEQARPEHYGHPKQFIGTARPKEMPWESLGQERLSLRGDINPKGNGYEADVLVELNFLLEE